MKIPKSLIICGKTYTITTNKKVGGAWFSWNSQKIELGLKNTKERQMASFIHEIVEVIMVEKDLRFQLNRAEPENGDYMFIFSHKDFEVVAEELEYVLRQIYGS